MSSATTTPDKAAVAPETPAEVAALDDLTMQRFVVAHATADTLEHMGSTHCWRQLDPSISAHLVGQAVRLRAFLGQVRGSGAVRGRA